VRIRRVLPVLLAAGVFAMPAAASAHARVSPAVSLAGQLQLYTLAVPTEQNNVSTTKVVLSVPSGFSIDSFAPSPGWRRSLAQKGTGEGAAVQKVTWSGGGIPTGEDSVFQFLAQPAAAKTYSFTVQQTYSNGSIVNWTGPESAADPAPSIQAVSSFGSGGAGDGVSTLSIIAVILSALALLAGGFSLAGGRGGGRPLA
jgi:uncharacterized protein YcnI